MVGKPMTLTLDDINRLERAALVQLDKQISTTITIMPGQLMALCAQARLAPAFSPAPASTGEAESS